MAQSFRQRIKRNIDPQLLFCSRPEFVMATGVTSRCNAARRRRHEFRADWIGDGFTQNPIYLGLGGGIERPANHSVNWLQLIRMTRPPQCCCDSLVEHPANRQVNSALAEALRKAIELGHGGEVLCEPMFLELRVSAPQIVAAKNRIRLHASRQEAPA
jgi:hypothetical protein